MSSFVIQFSGVCLRASCAAVLALTPVLYPHSQLLKVWLGVCGGSIPLESVLRSD